MLIGVRRTFRSLPRLMRVGLAIVSLGAGIDIAYHVGTSDLEMGRDPIALTGHLVTLIGMAVTMLGLLSAALMRRTSEIQQLRKGEPR